MAFQNISAVCYLAASVSWEDFGLFAVAAAGAALLVLLRKARKQPAPEDPPVKLFSPRFNQRYATAQVELRPNPVRRYASCHCLDAQYEPDELGEEGDEENVVRLEWQELLFHTEVQDETTDAWKSLEAHIAKIRDEGSDELNPM